MPLDFFTWHSYGGRGEANPYRLLEMARQVRAALDAHGFKHAESILGEWNAGIDAFNFSDTPAGAAYYASALMCLLDAGVDRALQYCGDNHPMLGLHRLDSGEPKLSAFAFAAWKRMLETPDRLAATGSDERGYNVLAGKDAYGRRVRVLISDFQSGQDAFHLHIANLPWSDTSRFAVRVSMIDGSHRLSAVEQSGGRGRSLEFKTPFSSGKVCLVEVEASGN